MTTTQAYTQLRDHFREIATLKSIGAVLGWDQKTYMPKDGINHRAAQVGQLSRLIHERATDPRIDDWLATCETDGVTVDGNTITDPEAAEMVNIREIRYRFDRQRKLPVSLVTELATVTTSANSAWTEAREKSDFSIFRPWLEKILELVLAKAEAYGYEGDIYNALLEDFEPHTTVDDIDRAFEPLRGALIELVGRVTTAPNQPDYSILKRPYDLKKQKIMGEMVARAFGYDFNAGRLDETAHAFCTSLGPNDIRILTRYSPNDFRKALRSTMHETGHALYNAGLGQGEGDQYGLPMNEPISLGVHESQSRLWENQVGRSRQFWSYFFPIVQPMFRESLGDVSFEEFYGAMNYVSPMFLRLESDEATYNLHIILRYELERAMVTGDLKVADLPEAWNAKVKDYLGLTVTDDALGCLQDTHWSGGMIGYFPTYTLGNLYSAMWFDTAVAEMPDLAEDFTRGDFSRMLGWLRENIHRHAKRYRATELCEKVTGRPLSHDPMITYLTEKYREIYGF